VFLSLSRLHVCCCNKLLSSWKVLATLHNSNIISIEISCKMAPHNLAQLLFVGFALLFINDCNSGKLKETRFDVQVKILRSPERTSYSFKKALRTKIRKLNRRARFGGELDFTTPYFLHANGNITGGCRKIRVSRFIGNKDRNCTSVKPVRYSLCGGFCLPKFRLTQLIFGSHYNRILQKAKHRWRCVANTFRYKKVRVFCPDDGSILRYRIKIVNSCICKEFKREHNDGRTANERLADSKLPSDWTHLLLCAEMIKSHLQFHHYQVFRQINQCWFLLTNGIVWRHFVAIQCWHEPVKRRRRELMVKVYAS